MSPRDRHLCLERFVGHRGLDLKPAGNSTADDRSHRTRSLRATGWPDNAQEREHRRHAVIDE